MLCRKCGDTIKSSEGDHPVLGYSCQLDDDGTEIPGSKQQFGFFHAACWKQVKAALGPDPQEQPSAN